ncbi:hypothetical protein PV327_009089 [Microctonus hyperodae]|uniref:Uncharacterized protein n=1 Tax=Microctonus hyperodae TaxID=165561 RepID=A0AA39KVL9_MICHY|nr:hypothetical protein PV327_009089 [Microctonus hyperodae]
MENKTRKLVVMVFALYLTTAKSTNIEILILRVKDGKTNGSVIFYEHNVNVRRVRSRLYREGKKKSTLN